MTDLEAGRSAASRITSARDAIVDLLNNKGMYAAIEVTSDVGKTVERMLRDRTALTFDGYCVSCEREMPFFFGNLMPAERKYTAPGVVKIEPDVFDGSAACKRCSTRYYFTFHVSDGQVQKIGQLPSIADIALRELKDIDRDLDRADRAELGRAIGLFAHGIAIGAFVYLRRVFERLIARTYNEFTAAHPHIERFDGLRMNEKIDLLEGVLPASLVRNPEVYAILSLGIHELTEEQCALGFPALKAILFEILEEDIRQKRRAAASRESERAIKALHQSVIKART